MDEMRLESKFTTVIASKLAEKLVRDKLGYDVDIRLNRLRTNGSGGQDACGVECGFGTHKGRA